MNSKRFVYGIISTVIMLLVGIYSLLWILPDAYYMTPGEYGSWKQQLDFTQEAHENIDVLLLGDSRMKIDVDPQKLGPNVYSIALSGCNPIDMYYSLKRYLANNKVPHLVVIGYAPTHLTKMENYLDRSLYFRYLSDEEISEANENIKNYDGKDFSGETIKFKYRSPAIYMHAILHNIRKQAKAANEAEYKQLAEQRGGMFLDAVKADDDVVRPEETKEIAFRPLASLDYYLRETVRLCKANKIPVVIVQFPMGQYGVDKLAQSGYLHDYEEYMKDIQAEFSIPVQYNIPVYENKYFADNSHLNRAGNSVYTEELKKNIARWGLKDTICK